MATYVNDLRLKEITTGDESGTWGTSTNTNLELIGEALGYNTQDCFSSDADATTTVADGVSDPARAMYFKVTSSATLTATRTLTVAPNTISRVMFIENATTGSQSITISQGSGANVTISNGRTTVVYLDGAGAAAAVVDALALVDPGVTDTLAETLVAGNTSGGTGLVMSSGDDLTLTGASYNVVWDSSDSALEFADSAKAIFGAGGDLEIFHNASNSIINDGGTGNLQLQTGGATKLEVTSGGVTVTGVMTGDVTGDLTGTVITAAQANITSVGTLTSLAVSGDLTVDTNTLKVDSTNNRVGVLNASPAVSLDAGSATDAFHVPVGTTAQRPTGAAGHFRYNTTLEQFEGYTDDWGQIGGGGGANAFATDSYTGDGSTTAYALSQVVVSEDNLLVFIEGVFQQQDAYSIATAGGATTLTFSAAPANGNDILIYSVVSAISGTNLNSDTMTGDGSDTTLTLSLAPVNENNTQVYIDGVYQNKDTYSISGTTLTFSAAPPNGSAVEVMTMNQLDINTPTDGSVTSAKLSGDLVTPGALDVTGTVTADGLTVQTTNGLNALLESTTSYQYLQFKNSAETNNFIGFVSDDFVVSPANNQKLIVTAEGNVGIGLSSPTSRLQLDGAEDRTGGLTLSAGGQNHTYFLSSDFVNVHNIETSSSAAAHTWQTNGTERMRIDASGNLLVGKTSANFNSSGRGNIEIEGTGSAILALSAGSDHAYIYNSGSELDILAPAGYAMRFFTDGSNERMRIDASGNVGIGTSPSTTLEIANTGNGTAGPILRLTNPDVTMSSNQGIGAIEFFNSDATGLGARVATNIQSFAANTSGGGYLTFGVSPNAGTVSEAMRIGSSGNLLVGTTAANFSISSEVMDGFGVSGSGKFVTIGVNNNYCLALQRNGSDGIIQYFFNDTASAGNISVSGSTVTYNTSSDQRLKENIADADDAGSKIDAIQVRKFDWKADGSHQDYGMIAQELQTVAPEAVSAPEDPEEMMGVDYSKLVPMLVKEIQSLRARVAQLENN